MLNNGIHLASVATFLLGEQRRNFPRTLKPCISRLRAKVSQLGFRLFVSLILLAGAIVRAQAPPAQKAQTPAATVQTPPTPVVSPEVLADHRVTFRLRLPDAKEVSVRIDGTANPLAMLKDVEGIWNVTTEPLAPDYYGYIFLADGAAVLDPSNNTVRPNLLQRANEVHVPPASGDSSDSFRLSPFRSRPCSNH